MTNDTNILLKRHLFTIRDYHLMAESGVIPPDSRVELLHGEIIEMSPINSQHAGTVKQLNRLLSKLLDENYILSIQDPIEISHSSEPEPDLAILKYRADIYTTSNPKPKDVLLIIEVADSSLEKDREIKLPLYSAAGIPQTWIVNLQDQQVEVYTQPTEQGYSNRHIYRKGDILDNDLIPELAIDNIFL